jgi:hypothetical protein
MTFVDLVKRYLADDVDAQLFAQAFMLYCHAIDDIVDGDKTDHLFVMQTFNFAQVVYTSAFFMRHWAILAPVIHNVFLDYEESVTMERSSVQWQRQYADVMRQNANVIFLQCIELVAGIQARREASIQLREISYRNHHNEKGEAI